MGEPTIETQSLPDAESVVSQNNILEEVYLSHKTDLFGLQVSLKILNVFYI